jgi:hypothetical protein
VRRACLFEDERSPSPVVPTVEPVAISSDSEGEWGGFSGDEWGGIESTEDTEGDEDGEDAEDHGEGAESAENVDDETGAESAESDDDEAGAENAESDDGETGAENAESDDDETGAENAESDDDETMPSLVILDRVRENHRRMEELCAENRRLLGVGRAVTRGAGLVSRGKEMKYPSCPRPRTGAVSLAQVKGEINEVRRVRKMCEAKVVGLYLLGEVKLGGQVGAVKPRKPVCQRCRKRGVACLEVDRAKERRVFTSSCAECKVAASRCFFLEGEDEKEGGNQIM